MMVQVFDAMFRVIKESENVDERQHCFLIQTFGQQSHYFSVETRQVSHRIFCCCILSFMLGIFCRSCYAWSLPGTRLCASLSLNSGRKLSTWFTRTGLQLSHLVRQVTSTKPLLVLISEVFYLFIDLSLLFSHGESR